MSDPLEPARNWIKGQLVYSLWSNAEGRVEERELPSDQVAGGAVQVSDLEQGIWIAIETEVPPTYFESRVYAEDPRGDDSASAALTYVCNQPAQRSDAGACASISQPVRLNDGSEAIVLHLRGVSDLSWLTVYASWVMPFSRAGSDYAGAWLFKVLGT